MMAKVAVIGAGPAGCIAALRLKQQNHDVTLFEAARQVGGRTFSYRKGGYHLDTGAGFFTNFYPTFMRTLKALGMKNEIISLDRTTSLIYQKKMGHLKLGSLRSYTQYPFLSLKNKLIMGAHAAHLTATRYRYNLTELKKLKAHDNQSIADFVRKELNEEIYQFIIRAGIEPFWYFSCENVSRSLYLALTAQAIDAKFYTLRQGMDTFCKKIACSLTLRLNHKVATIVSDETTNTLRVTSSHTNDMGEAIKSELFDKVIIATTANIAHSITHTLNTRFISEFQRSYLQSQRYTPNIHTSYLVKQFRRQPQGTSLFPCGPGKHALAAIGFNSQKSEDIRRSKNELISIYMSGERSQQLITSPTSELSELCYQEARKTYRELPQQQTPFYQAVRTEAIPIPEVGRYHLAYQFQEAQRGPIAFAGDYLTTPTIEGAIVSGESAVNALSQ